MAILNFPNSPTNGQIHTENNRTWVWDAANTRWLPQVQATFTIFDSDGTTPIIQFYGNSIS